MVRWIFKLKFYICFLKIALYNHKCMCPLVMAFVFMFSSCWLHVRRGFRPQSVWLHPGRGGWLWLAVVSDVQFTVCQLWPPAGWVVLSPTVQCLVLDCLFRLQPFCVARRLSACRFLITQSRLGDLLATDPSLKHSKQELYALFFWAHQRYMCASVSL